MIISSVPKGAAEPAPDPSTASGVHPRPFPILDHDDFRPRRISVRAAAETPGRSGRASGFRGLPEYYARDFVMIPAPEANSARSGQDMSVLPAPWPDPEGDADDA
jgi:hypothetical protein